MSYAKLTSANSEWVTIEVKIPLSKSMLQAEEKTETGLNEVGAIATRKALEKFDADGSPIMIGSSKFTSKGKSTKNIKHNGVRLMSSVLFIKVLIAVPFIAPWRKMRELSGLKRCMSG